MKKPMSIGNDSLWQTSNAIPDPQRIGEHGINIPVPTPTQIIIIPNPYAPNGGPPVNPGISHRPT